MGNYSDLIWLLGLASIIGLWLKLTRLRELAVLEARRQCERHGLQLLDESVGLRSLRWRKLHGRGALERCYGFEVSIDGNDRAPGRLWFAQHRLTGVSLPVHESVELDHSSTLDADAEPHDPGNVIPFRRSSRAPGPTRRIH